MRRIAFQKNFLEYLNPKMGENFLLIFEDNHIASALPMHYRCDIMQLIYLNLQRLSVMECIIPIELKAELNPRQRKAILHLLSARTVKEAAREAKIRLPTLYKWMKEPAFRQELERLRSEIVSDTVAQLKVHSLQAVSILADLMHSSENEQIKRGCATDILENTRSFIQLRDLEMRLSVLEEAIASPLKDHGGVHVYKGNH